MDMQGAPAAMRPRRIGRVRFISRSGLRRIAIGFGVLAVLALWAWRSMIVMPGDG
jgi:hypothetical protein